MSRRRPRSLGAAEATDHPRSNGATGGLPAALSTTATASAMPYGYTISVWSAGAILMHDHGLPQVSDVFAFLAGALIAFGLIAWAADHRAHSDGPIDHPSHRLLAGALHWFAAGGAVGVVVFAAELPGRVAWGVSSFAATSVFMLAASVQLLFVTRLRRRDGARQDGV